MSSTPKLEETLRDAIIAKPDAILDDQAVMQALIAADDRSKGDNIIDLRGVAMERLEARLDRLEDTHRSVIEAAYENLSSTNQVHRAILRMLDATEFETFLRDLGGPVASILRVEAITLVLETTQGDHDTGGQHINGTLTLAGPGFVDSYLARGRRGAPRQVSLRAVTEPDPRVYGDKAHDIRSEACMKLDFGPDKLPGLLVMGAAEPTHFAPQQATDILAFFTGVFERTMRRWLS
ncbi:DUF484 family protein [Microbulbifer sp. S227A]|uniref:DUF484 family protein n=1 Tax=Microbulbifer sp. S227A TaxID=3415131 RepID=UPI003C7980B2